MTDYTICIAGQRNETVQGDPFVEMTVEELGLHEDNLTSDQPWTRLAVWALDDGDWYAARFRPGHGIEPPEVAEARRIHRPAVESEQLYLGGPATEEQADEIVIGRTLEFFEWSWLAKHLADKQRWPSAIGIGAAHAI